MTATEPLTEDTLPIEVKLLPEIERLAWLRTFNACLDVFFNADGSPCVECAEKRANERVEELRNKRGSGCCGQRKAAN